MMISCVSCKGAEQPPQKNSDTTAAQPEGIAPLDAVSVPETADSTSADTGEIPQTSYPDLPEPQAPDPLPLAGKRICVDPGHGSFTNAYNEPVAPGASQTKPAFVSGTAGSYQSEAEFNLKVALKLRDALTSAGATVYMTREDENAVLSNIGRAQLANDMGCDLAVRIHADGSENTSARGISMLVPGEGGYITDTALIETSTQIGEIVLAAVIERTGAPDRGVIPRNDMTGFNWCAVPSILIECGFMSNPEEDELLFDDGYQQMLAEGIAAGIIEYYE